MRRRKVLSVLMAAVLTVCLPLTTSAATWDGVDDYEKLANAFTDTDAEVHIILSGNIANENSDMLTAGEGQSYKIDGQEYTLTDIQLDGSGTVEINADLEGQKGDALYVEGQVSVTVNGDISSLGAERGVYADEESTVTVNGDISATEQDAVRASGDASVAVTGDIYGGDGADGLEVKGNAQVTVVGDVYAGSGADGVDAEENAQVTVVGDVYGGSGEAPDAEGNLNVGNINSPGGYSDGGSGIEVSDHAQVFVDGDVYGGDSYGTFSYGGAGVAAEGYAKVEITGNAVGGDLIANPDVVPDKSVNADGIEEVLAGYAGDGVMMESTADITVGGNAVGGESSAHSGLAGCGAYIVPTLTAEITRDSSTGDNLVETLTPGQLTVGGSVIGGKATAENGLPGNAIFVRTDNAQNPVAQAVFPDEIINAVITSNDSAYLRECVSSYIKAQVFEAGLYYIDEETRLDYKEEYTSGVKALAAEYGVDVEALSDLEEIVGAVPDEKLAEFVEKALELGNNLIRSMVPESYAFPEIKAGKLIPAAEMAAVEAWDEEMSDYILENFVQIMDQDDDSGEIPGGDEGSKGEAPGGDEGSKDETPGGDEGSKGETPGGDEGSKDETPGGDEGSKGEKDPGQDIPKTGDSTDMTLKISLFVLSMAAVLFLVLRMKRKTFA